MGRGADPHQASVLRRPWLERDDLGFRFQRIPRINGNAEDAAPIAQRRHGTHGDVGNGLAESDLEYQNVVQGAGPVAKRLREGFRALQRKARAREHSI